MMEELLQPLQNHGCHSVEHLDYESCLLGSIDDHEEKEPEEKKDVISGEKMPQRKDPAEIIEQ